MSSLNLSLAPVRARQTLRPARVALAALILCAGHATWAQAPTTPAASAAGEIESVRGIGFVQTPGQAPRSLSKGTPLLEGDRVSTASQGSAVVVLRDGTRMTVRPESDLVLSQYRFSNGANDNSMVLNLLKGGLRALTGLINKGQPNAARLQTATATVGIRGTDFDARLCQGDCARESTAVGGAPRGVDIKASARLVALQGEAFAVDAAGQRRLLANGGPVYSGELIETAAGANAVLVFRDDSRVTLGPTTRFKVDQFAFDPAKPQEGRFLVSLLKGSLRALSGAIGKANNRNVLYTTRTATVGIRGTGQDIVCTGTCADEPDAPGTGFSVLAWLGSIEVTPGGQTLAEVLLSGQGVFIGTGGRRSINSIDTPLGPRPDGVTVPPNLFGQAPVSEGEEGLFIFVRDGHIEVTTATGVLQLGRDEIGLARPDGSVDRAMRMPRFIEFDRLPLPSTQQFTVRNLLNEAGLRESQQCR